MLNVGEIYISTNAANSGASAFVVIAELTGIDNESMYILTGSGLTTLDGT